jgi:hypothetical protein
MSAADSPTERPPRPLWLKLLIAAAFAFALFNLGAFLYGLTLSDKWHVERSVVIHAPPGAVYPLLASPKRWPEWTEWNSRVDPTVKLTAEGPESGAKASLVWMGREIGMGKVTILEAVPNRAVTYELKLQGTEFTKNGRLALEPTDAGTRVIWTDGGKIGNTVGRLFRRRFEQNLAAHFDTDLNQLKAVVEKQHPGEREGEAPAEPRPEPPTPEGRATGERRASALRALPIAHLPLPTPSSIP